ncbi:MAG TPA: hypothetical protein VMU42_16650 [Candidatus Sulfotelmatobacter sp.]|nr:hypothetical protein [Candidatus Sulfotelmatobacter sp.]
MKLLGTVFRELTGLFLDDAFLAVAALGTLGIAGLLIKALGIAPLIGGGLLLAGSVASLLVSVWRGAVQR